MRITEKRLKRVAVVPEILLALGDKDKKRIMCIGRNDCQPQLTPMPWSGLCHISSRFPLCRIIGGEAG